MIFRDVLRNVLLSFKKPIFFKKYVGERNSPLHKLTNNTRFVGALSERP